MLFTLQRKAHILNCTLHTLKMTLLYTLHQRYRVQLLPVKGIRISSYRSYVGFTVQRASPKPNAAHLTNLPLHPLKLRNLTASGR